MKLYHLSLDLVDKFKPKIPSTTSHNENKTINRVCLAPTIEDCLSALGWGGSTVIENDILYGILNKFNKTKPIVVYEFEINKDLLTPQELASLSYLDDALITNEYWYVGKNELKPKNIKFISIFDFKFKKIYLSDNKFIFKFMDIKFNELNDVIYSNYVTVENNKKYPIDKALMIDKIFYETHPTDNFTDVGFYKMNNKYNKIIIDIGEPILINKKEFKERLLEEEINFIKIY